MNGFILRENVPVKQSHNSEIFPEIHRHVLQAPQVRPIFSNAGALIVAHANLLEDVPAQVEHDKSLVARAGVHARLGFGVAAEIPYHHTVGVIANLVSLRPDVAPDRICRFRHEMTNGVRPRTQWNATMRQMMVFLNGAAQFPRREARKIVVKKVSAESPALRAANKRIDGSI